MTEAFSASDGDNFDDGYIPPSDPPFDDEYDYSPPSRRDDSRSGLTALPHDTEAEQATLGVMVQSTHSIFNIVEILDAEDFYDFRHQLIFTAILDVALESDTIDPVIVKNRLEQVGNLDRVGGAPYLAELVSAVPAATNVLHYAKIVADKAALRRIVAAGQRVQALGSAATEGEDIDMIIDRAQQEVMSVSLKQRGEDYHSMEELLPPVVEEIRQLQEHGALESGVPTGFIDLDNLTNGLHAGQMIIVAARPGVGKSTLALDFMRSCSINNGKTSIIFSLEMSSSEILMRILSAESEVKLADMRGGHMDDGAWAALTDTLREIQEAPLYIDDSPNLTMTDIRTKARRLKEAQGLDLIVLDYLQLMSSGKKVESRQQEVSEFSRQLKLLAKELEVPLVAISQLNRGPEARTDKRPQLADLRESGSLEQDADMVMLLYRPDSQDRDNERAGEADIILAKHRGGQIDTVTVAHQLHYSRFVNMAHG